MIQNIVLDMGNVCCRWDPQYLAGCLHTDSQKQQIIIQELFQSHEWALMDEGKLSLKQGLADILQHVDEQDRDLIVYAFNNWYHYFDQIEGMEELIQEYKKKGYHFYLLSNCSLQFDKYYQDKSIFCHFEKMYISARYQLLKPSLAIYQDFLSRFQLKAKTCLFVDDMKINVEGAKQAGMAGYCFDGNVEKLRNFLKNL